MFSGIVAGIGEVAELREQPPFFELCVQCDLPILEGLISGASVSVNGVCLTAKKIEGVHAYFDLSSETLAKTTLGTLQNGTRVNMERAITYGDEIGGHMVSGHIDTTGTVREIINDASGIRFKISCAPEFMKYVIQKGFISIDGVSLTINDPGEQDFYVHIIPETMNRTILSLYTLGDKVNIEFDTLTQTVVDTVERILNKSAHIAIQ